MRFSERVLSIEESGIRAIFNLVVRSKDIINLSIGEPDLDTPSFIKDAAKKALDQGYTHYAPTKGYPDLLEALALKLKRENGIDVNPESEVMVTVGGTQAIYLALTTLLCEGEEVLIPSPAFVQYFAATKLAGGVPIEVGLGEDYSIEPDNIRRAITKRTKILILNSPSNPTGAVSDAEKIKEAASIAVENGLMIISDEVYEKFVYEGKHFSPASVPDFKGHVITVNSLSKAFAMTGWRLGYVAAPPEVIEQMAKVQMYSSACIPSFIQKAAVEALHSQQSFFDDVLREYRRRRDTLCNILSDCPYLSFKKPKGAFYLFPRLKGIEIPSKDLVMKMIKEIGVAVVPGSAFGKLGEGCIRISYATSIDKVEEGARRITKFLTITAKS
ncbi:MAG: pyridoxal phosphate-dependent aminotransferase [Nitrososphaerales archaeon]